MKARILFIMLGLLALATLMPAYNFGVEDLGPIIRVCILDNQDSIDVNLKGAYTVVDIASSKVLWSGQSLKAKVTGTKSGMLIGDKEVALTDVRFNVVRDSDILINDRSFRGSMDITRKPSLKLMAVNRLPVESYLYGVLRHEVSPHWPMESLKAQAIVARTFALQQARQNKLQPYDVRNDIYSQVYGGSSSEKWTTTKAVRLTRNQVLTYKGDIFTTYYHAACAGRTEDASQLWNVNIPPLSGVPCNFCGNSPHYRWKKELAPDFISEKLNAAGHKIGKVASIEILSRDRSRRIDKISIKDEAGATVVLGAKDFRHMIGPNDIRSTNFYIHRRWGNFIIYGFGWGHGVGMCQWGAYGLSKRGKTAEQILHYYYPGTAIMTLDKISNKP